jgi:flagellar basal-body rod protein FlgG
MIRGIYTAASGMVAETIRTDSIANNLANVNTAGFKRDQAVSKDFGSILIERINDGAEAVPIGQLGLGSIIDQIAPIHSQGVVKKTDNQLDIAIDGKGFLAVNTPNGIRYTRNGSFTVSGRGQLVTHEGYQILGQNGPINTNNGKVDFTPDGAVVVNGVEVDRLRLVDFNDVKQLMKQGASLYETPANLRPSKSSAQIRQGFLEMSNVNVVSEMVNLINSFRSYESNSKAIEAQDQLLQKAANEVGKS